MARPLEGIRVVELANFIAGPFCCMLLADMGADVVKIEPPDRGDMTRASFPQLAGESAGFMAINRNKRSLALDLKAPAAIEAVLKLVRTADVVVENFRPGALEKLGLGAERLRAVKPELIYTSVSGFGQTGPYRQKAAVNLIIEAASGMLSVMGEPGQVPGRPGIQTADVIGALFALYSILAGLVGKLRFGEGRTADVSMLEASIAAAFWESATYFATGQVPEQLGRRHRVTAPYQLFETSDGYLAIGAPNESLYQRLLEVLGLEALREDARFATVAQRKAHDVELGAAIEARTRLRATAELAEALDRAGVPAAPVNDYGQVFADPQVRFRQVELELEHPRVGRTRATRNPVRFDHDGPRVDRPAPTLGQHSREVLAELGYGSDEIERLVTGGVVGVS